MNLQSSKVVHKHRTGGLSLAELLVTMAIVSIVVLGAFQVFNEGLKLFKTNQQAADAQSAVLKVMGRLNSELANANSRAVRIYSSTNPGFVFTSPLAENGDVQYNDTTAAVYWQKYICYYFEPNPATPAKGKIVRVEEDIADQGVEALKTGDSRLNTVIAGLSTRTTSYFRANSSLKRRTLGDAISGFEIKLFDGQIVDATGNRSVLGGSGVTRKDSYDLRIQAGDNAATGPDSYFIQVDSRVTPRG